MTSGLKAFGIKRETVKPEVKPKVETEEEKMANFFASQKPPSTESKTEEQEPVFDDEEFGAEVYEPQKNFNPTNASKEWALHYVDVLQIFWEAMEQSRIEPKKICAMLKISEPQNSRSPPTKASLSIKEYEGRTIIFLETEPGNRVPKFADVIWDSSKSERVASILSVKEIQPNTFHVELSGNINKSPVGQYNIYIEPFEAHPIPASCEKTDAVKIINLIQRDQKKNGLEYLVKDILEIDLENTPYNAMYRDRYKEKFLEFFASGNNDSSCPGKMVDGICLDPNTIEKSDSILSYDVFLVRLKALRSFMDEQKIVSDTFCRFLTIGRKEFNSVVDQALVLWGKIAKSNPRMKPVFELFIRTLMRAYVTQTTSMYVESKNVVAKAVLLWLEVYVQLPLFWLTSTIYIEKHFLSMDAETFKTKRHEFVTMFKTTLINNLHNFLPKNVPDQSADYIVNRFNQLVRSDLTLFAQQVEKNAHILK